MAVLFGGEPMNGNVAKIEVHLVRLHNQDVDEFMLALKYVEGEWGGRTFRALAEYFAQDPGAYAKFLLLVG